MDQFLAALKSQGLIVTREVPVKGPVEVVIVEQRHETQPGVFVETYIPVDDFKTLFPTPADLKKSDPKLGYGPFAASLQGQGLL